jgi:hypothetical protein
VEWPQKKKMHIERENHSVLAKVTQVSDVAHGPLVLEYIIKSLNECSVLLSVCRHTVKCLKYDVLSKAVSIHLPLSRYLAGNVFDFKAYYITVFITVIIIFNL